MTTKDEAMKLALEALEATLETLDNANSTPGGPIADTIWHTETETLFDFIADRINVVKQAIDTSGQRVEDSADGGNGQKWSEAFDAWWITNRIDAHNIKNARGFSRKVWKAAMDSVAGATDSTTGFYPVDGGSIPPRQASLLATDDCSNRPPMTNEKRNAKIAFESAYLPLPNLKFEQEAQQQASAWIPVEQQMPEPNRKVLAFYKNELGHIRRICARWVKAKTIESNGDSEIGEYDEATDTYYDPEGWYECIENWDDYNSVFVSQQITHWMPLPPAPREAAPAQEGGAA